MAPRGLPNKKPTKLFVFDAANSVLYGVWEVSPDGAVERRKEIPPISDRSFLSDVLPRADELRPIGGVPIFLNKEDTKLLLVKCFWYRNSRGGRPAPTRTAEHGARRGDGGGGGTTSERSAEEISAEREQEVMAQSQAEADSAAEAQQIEDEAVRRAKAESLREDGDDEDAVSELRKALVERLQNMCPGATADACNDALDDCGDDEEEALALLLDGCASTPGSDGEGELTQEEFLRRLADAMAASEEERVADVEADVIQDSMEAEEARAEAAAQQEEHLAWQSRRPWRRRMTGRRRRPSIRSLR